MTRLKADILLFIATIIWGSAFVAQKDSMAHLGPFAFIAARFFLSFLCVIPFALRERRRIVLEEAKSLWPLITAFCIVFTAGVILQQKGIVHTSVTNAGFLTGLYVLFVPLIGYALYRTAIRAWILPAALLCVAGTWFMSNGMSSVSGGLNIGDMMVLGCALCFGFHVVFVGKIMNEKPAPLQLSCLQYAVATVVCGAAAFFFENNLWQNFLDSGVAILYAGVISGGLAYTLQIIAQQYTPPSDTAVILSAEAVFAAIFGFLLMGDRLNAGGIFGCILIAAGILLVELGPLLKRKNPGSNTPA
jgi:drug/metabolite transporter (DMT)-like permease